MKLSRAILAGFLTIIVWALLNQFFFSTRFNFSGSAPFEGKEIYNPYKTASSGNWIKSNFHAHAAAWKGVTNGSGNAYDIHHAYDSLGYGIHTVSNYHSIDTVFSEKENYISAYEHGYNIYKTHQLILGSQKIIWTDYILPQTLHNKQDILNYLSRDTNSVIVLNHPKVRAGYASQDFSYLTNYHCMEVLNPSAVSVGQWDAALSAGKPVFIVGNDDIHDVLKKERLGRMCTFVNVPKPSGANVLQALKQGKSYGVSIGETQDPFKIPSIKSLDVSKNVIELQVDKPAKRITFTGQNGRTLAEFKNTSHAFYTLKQQDHYARATVDYDNGTQLYLNPVFFANSSILVQDPVSVNHLQTAIFRLIGLIIAGIWINWSFWFVLRGRSMKMGRFSLPFLPGRSGLWLPKPKPQQGVLEVK